MSVQDGRLQTVSINSSSNRRRRILLVLGSLFLILFAGQVGLQIKALNKVEQVEDSEQLRQLQKLALPEVAKPNVDWPQWRGPNRDGISTETGLLTQWPNNGPRKLWEQQLGSGYSSPVLSRGLFYAFYGYHDFEYLVCLDVETGKESWRFRYPARYQNEFGDGPRSTPTIDGDLIFTVGGTGIMHCLRLPEPGKTDKPAEVVWKKDLLQDFNAANLKWGVSFSPLVVDDLVYINPGGKEGNSIAALDKHTGAVRWKALKDQAGYSSPLAIRVADQPQILFFTAEGLVGVTPDKGDLLWRFPWLTMEGCNIATPIVVQDYVFISTGYNRGCALVKIDKMDEAFTAHRVYENKKMRNHFQNSVRHQDYLYGFNENVLTCLELRTGKVRWSENYYQRGSLVYVDGHFIVLGEQGILTLVEATSEGYREKARCQISDRRCWTMPVFANGQLYIRDQDKIMCLDVRQ